jgi:ceramide glucosyltransferase
VSNMLHMLGRVALGWSFLAGGVQVEAVRRSLFGRSSRLSPSTAAARVLLIRPCAGTEACLATTLPSLAAARRSFVLSCRFAVAASDDTSLPAVRAAAAALSAAGIDASVILTASRGPNRKAAQLAAVVAVERAPVDLVLVADRDVDLTGTDLDALVAPLMARADLAAVWAPPIEAAPAHTLGDRASAAVLHVSLHAFPLLAGLDRAGLVGKLFVVRGDALREAGGFEALVSHLGEDMELARRLRTLGHAIEAAPMVARSLASGRSWEQVESRFARWITVIRAQRPALLASYPGLFLALAPIVILAVAAATSAPFLAAIATTCAVLTRLAVAAGAAHATGRSLALPRLALPRLISDALLADVLLTSAFVRSMGSRRVVWREVALTVDPRGRLHLADEG